MRAPRQRHPAPSEPNEGEGSRTAARRYEQGVRQTVESGHVDEAAREAMRALDGTEGADLRKAEALGKQRKAGNGRAAKSKKH